ncbi:sulfurtransferase [Homoserinibacter sp. YIM 151385]|uniref:sulfurtransferase n=1 Tax=Homoserinibacter sp. YIM 151385 TaxID=2985506 RepID=UPI0022F0531F|nr:rhodanese-like domain-containing protein [Homoserinibacter sp. YIM 151385]WBU37973.1 rhodanese-like domain-containing protein [Homoserinibacter sp. YIM 151385]
MSAEILLPATAPLVSTQWLADHLGARGLLVLDATVQVSPDAEGRPSLASGAEAHVVDGHLPGAVFADLLGGLSDAASPLRFTRPAPEALALALGALGVHEESAVVVYDDAHGQWAARLWWLLRSAGHERAAVLDGGLERWRREQRPLETGHVEPSPAVLATAPRPELWARREEVEAVSAGDAPGSLVCAAPAAEYRGERAAAARPGHIPGSVSIPLAALRDRESGRLHVGEARDAVLAPARTGGRIIAYCTSGVAACAAALALVAAGEEAVSVYDGSLEEWAAVPGAPLVTV